MSEPLSVRDQVAPSYGSFDGQARNPVQKVDSEFESYSSKQSHLAFINLSYTIPSGLFSKKEGKVILDSVSGLMVPGLNAIMGPTGSGKTTLLDILADRKSSSRVQGTLLYNSECIDPNFRFNTGYVVQDDVVTGTLTVRENFHFSAALRLPSHMTSTERKTRVEKVLTELNLGGCADRKIGTEFIRGVSGGERKRTNIGMELIIEPKVLFLDEPTTGLDAHTAVSVVQLLKDLTKYEERIVIMSIHQPRYSIFKLFDTLTLLSLGNMVYHGIANEALDYFNGIGYSCEEHDNPADFFLDMIDVCERSDVNQANKSGQISIQTGPIEQKAHLKEYYLKSRQYNSTREIVEPLMNELSVSRFGRFDACSSHYATNTLWQFLIVAYRSVLKMWRNPMTNVMQTLVMVIFALVTGGIFYQRPDTPRGMQDKIGAIFFIVMSQVFGNLGAIELFINERVAFLHETSSGYYRVSVYFIAKVITDLIVMRTVPLSIFCAITYFMIGFQTDIAKFFLFYLTLSLITVAGASIAFTFSALVSVFAVANLLVSLVFILFMIFGGFLIGLSSLPSWIQWMKYISVFRYAIEAIAVNELKDQFYSEVIHNASNCATQVVFNETTNTTYCVAEGNAVLQFQGYNRDWILYDQLALLSTGILWLALAYTMLRAVKIYYRHYK